METLHNGGGTSQYFDTLVDEEPETLSNTLVIIIIILIIIYTYIALFS